MGKLKPLVSCLTDDIAFIELLCKHVPNLLFEQYTPEAIREESTITRDAQNQIQQLEFHEYTYTYRPQYNVVIEVYRGEETKYREQLPLRVYQSLRQAEVRIL